MTNLYFWLKYVHVLAGFLFLMGHGTSVFLAFQLKEEKDIPRMQAMLDLSGRSWPVTMASLLVLLLAGIVTAFMGHFWSSGWVWVSLVLLLGLTIWMFILGQKTYHPLRRMLGMPYMIGGTNYPAEKARPKKEIEAHLASSRPMEMFVIGVGGFAVILWLMMFKPF